MVRLVGILLLTGIVALLAVGLASVQAVSRQGLQQRFATRADLASQFIATYITSLMDQEESNADAWLAGDAVSGKSFEQVTGAMGFEAAVLLDDHGRLLQVVPTNPAILGTVIAPRYAHLTAAEAGQRSVSGVVPGAAAGQPVLGFAVPFRSSGGLRVLSGAFDVGRSPIGAYLRNSLPYVSARSDLIDASGSIIATSRRSSGLPTLTNLDEGLAREVGASPQGTGVDSRGNLFVARQIQGTPWRLINSVLEADIYSPPVSAGQFLPWMVLAGLAGAGLYVIVLVARLADGRAELSRLSITDALTQLPNRRRWEMELGREVSRAARTGQPLCVGMMDLDHFKRFNDSHGHQAGDILLAEAGRAWADQVRDLDTLARYGGEEFGMVLPACSISEALSVADRLRMATPMGQTVSTGVAEWDGVESAAELVGRADAALYEAKAGGRNRTLGTPTRQSTAPGQKVERSRPRASKRTAIRAVVTAVTSPPLDNKRVKP